MLALGLLSSALFPAFAIVGRTKQSTAGQAPISRMPCSHNPVQHTAAPAASCTDIEDMPPGLIEGYELHQAVEYHACTAEEVAMIRGSLLSWYDNNRRMLPWRGDPPPWTRAASAGTAAMAADSDASQPQLTSWFGSSSKQPPGVAGTSTERSSSSSSNSNARKRKKAGAEADGAEGKEERPPERIPVSAYGTWVSEVMLQQTRVETVVDYYVKWMTLFPTPQALAEADLEQVNKAWAGLGYYRRAKMLHDGAKKVNSDYGGTLPGTAKELKDLPGIGPYTAGAVASIAFGECEPLVDGNVIRVLSRLKAIASDPKSARLNKLCWDLAGSIIDPQRPGDFNQVSLGCNTSRTNTDLFLSYTGEALMELGATLCTVKSPKCSACPVRTICLAYKLVSAPKQMQNEAETLAPRGSAEEGKTSAGCSSSSSSSSGPTGAAALPATDRAPRGGRKARPVSNLSGAQGHRNERCGCTVCDVGEDGIAGMPSAVTDFPRKAAKTLVKDQMLSVSVVECDGPRGPQILLVKRPDKGLLAGQWECPCIILRDGSESRNAAASRAEQTAFTSEVPQKERLQAADSLLFSELGLSKTLVRSRESVGTVTHVFSHLRHTMQVERIKFADDATMGNEKVKSGCREVRWVDESDMGGLGITTGMKKVFALASKARSRKDNRLGDGLSAAKSDTMRKRKGKITEGADEEKRQRVKVEASPRSGR